MKIRTAIFGVYVAASAVGFAVLMRFMLAEVRPRYVASLRTTMTDSARLLTAGLEGRPLPERLGRERTGLRVRVWSADARVLLDTVPVEVAGEADYASDSGRQGLVKRVGERLLDEETPVSEDELRVSVPLRLADGTSGRLEISRPLRSVNAFIWAERKKLAGISLLVAGTLLVAGWFIATRLTRSVGRLTRYAQAVRDGRKEPPPPLSRATEIATLARAFEEMRDALEGRQHAERYTQALAHEMKAPLAGIRGAAELLQEEPPAEVRRKFLGNIRDETARMQASIDRLLELSSLEARKALAQTEQLSAGAVLAEAVAVVRPAARARKVELVVEEEPPVAVRGERVLLREALVNLLQNALDFSPRGKTVRVRIGEAEARVEFMVDDDGPGVPAYALEKVFDRFYSLPRPDSGRKSTGLGLTLVREIGLLHAGGVTLENRADGGCRARFWVPASAVERRV